MVKNTLEGEAPNVRAAFSSLTGTEAKPSLAELIRKGRLTKAIARAIPAGLFMSDNPTEPAIPPRNPALEINPRIAIPAAV